MDSWRLWEKRTELPLSHKRKRKVQLPAERTTFGAAVFLCLYFFELSELSERNFVQYGNR